MIKKIVLSSIVILFSFCTEKKQEDPVKSPGSVGLEIYGNLSFSAKKFFKDYFKTLNSIIEKRDLKKWASAFSFRYISANGETLETARKKLPFHLDKKGILKYFVLSVRVYITNEENLVTENDYVFQAQQPGINAKKSQGTERRNWQLTERGWKIIFMEASVF